MQPLTSYTCRITGAQTAALRACLEARGFEFREVPHALFAGQRDQVTVVCYRSGKLVVQGKGTRDFVEFVLEPEILKEARLGYEAVLNPELMRPRLGVDESGKGDLFGPLCVAGVYVNESVLRAWQTSGIRDSKRISSDRRVAELAELIRKTPGCVTAVVPIGNEAYNRLYARIGNVNKLLAWGHARVIENLMGQKHRMQPPPVRAISDQFAASAATLARALMPLGCGIELVQRHRAEEDQAVAAASILARDEFVRRLNLLSRRYGIELPKGCSEAAERALHQFVEKHGPDLLAKVAKLHFKTVKTLPAAGNRQAGQPGGAPSGSRPE